VSYLDDLKAEIIASIPVPSQNPVEATVQRAYADPVSGVRVVFVQYSGATDIPAQWSTDFDLVIGSLGGIDYIAGLPVLLFTNTSPPTISTMLVKG
jgi:hypothetical protein